MRNLLVELNKVLYSSFIRSRDLITNLSHCICSKYSIFWRPTKLLNKMRRLLFIALLFPTVTFCQKGYFSAGFGVDFPKGMQGFSARLHGGASMHKGVWMGGGIGLTKLEGYEGVIIPLTLQFNLAPVTKGNISPLFTVEPGMGVYNRREKVGNISMETTGGFTYYAGVGAAFSSPRHPNKSFLTAGYSQYTFTVNDIAARYGGFAIRAGVVLF